jgi:hypothetical protein
MADFGQKHQGMMSLPEFSEKNILSLMFMAEF